MNFNTELLHGSAVSHYSQKEILPPISQVSAFKYDNMEELEKVFAHKAMGYAYTRIGNPTLTAFENRMRSLECGANAVSCSSGMSAITLSLLALCNSGDEIIVGKGLYGGTINLFHDLEKFGIHTVFANDMTAEGIKPLISDKTRAIFGELISNPALNILDVRGVAKAANEAGVPLIVDSTTATPFIARPIELGANIVIHSTSKYINGGGNSIGGIIIDGGNFAWDFDKHTSISEFRKYGKMAFSIRLRTDIWENFGCCMSPVNAFLNYIGLDTLGLRMERICANADALAHAFNEIDGIEVNYLSLPHHKFHGYFESMLNGLGGGILTFRAGSKGKAFRIINSLKCAMIASNIGDLRTLVIHPASTLYARTPKEEMEAAGVYDDTIRVSVGIEDVNDLINDFKTAIQESKGE